jgi:DNA-directed RNA polymerase subunit RPC12/RpoP
MMQKPVKSEERFKVVPEIRAKMWDVVVCGNDHPCLLVIRPFRLGPGEVWYNISSLSQLNINFVCIDGGENYQDNVHLGSYRCRKCGQHILMDDNGFILRIRKRVDAA